MRMIGQTLSYLPIPLDHVDYMKVENGIYDDLYATHINKAVKQPNDYVVPDNWDEETYLHAKFNGNMISGNSDFGVENTAYILVKKRRKGTYKWFPFEVLEVDSSDDFNFVVFDKYGSSNTEYEYAVVPIIEGVEGTYFTADCKVSFNHLIIIDKDETYATMYDIQYNQQKNNTSSTVLPYQSKYPISVSNASNDYYTGNISATFIKDENCEPVLDGMVEYQEKVLDFLNNRKVKFIKDPHGKCWIASIGTTVTDDLIATDLRKISFDFTEVGDIESNEDMKKFGLLDISEEWWI